MHAAFCPLELESSTFYGNYSWPQDTAADTTISRQCVHTCLNGSRNASRLCMGNGAWADTDFTHCPTELTCQFASFNMVIGNGVLDCIELKYRYL